MQLFVGLLIFLISVFGACGWSEAQTKDDNVTSKVIKPSGKVEVRAYFFRIGDKCYLGNLVWPPQTIIEVPCGAFMDIKEWK
jgi:hypothetical protein